MKKTPILIPAKGWSERCPGKNLKLLGFTSDWLADADKQRAYVISDSDEILREARLLGLNAFYSPITTCELLAMLDCAEAVCPATEWVIYLPLTQPLRERDLLRRIDAMDSDRDFIVSSSQYKERTLFEVEGDSFVAASEERKGRMCRTLSHVDGAIYKIRMEYLKRIENAVNRNAAFWSGSFATLRNNMPFMDVDTPEDLAQLENLIDVLTYIGNGKST